ncbi:MAG: acyl-CoA dehydrogenase [Candidatus Binatota bacterium]|nr:acyl-CoA dehydrogenase [Candidatus Binatota bacterium]
MVSFDLSDDQKLLRDTIAAFAAGELRPLAHDADEAARIPDVVVAKAWELGLVQSAIPEAYGGFGDDRSAISGAIAAEELAYGDLAFALHVLAPRLLVYPLLDHGTDEQKQRWLPEFTGAAFRPATAAVVEPSMHFDLSALATTARADGGDWVLSGRKAFVPLGGSAEAILVYARRAGADGSADPLDGYRAVEAFLIDRSQAGVELRGPEKNMGVNALETYELALKDVRVPDTARLGGEGSIDFARLMNRSRIALGSLAVGVARAAYDYAREYAKERKAFGVAIAQKQAIAFLLAEMAIEIDAARLLVWQAGWKIDRGEEATRESYLAKNYAASMALKVADNAVQVLGGHGYIRDHPVELWLRNARGFSSFEGMAIV